MPLGIWCDVKYNFVREGGAWRDRQQNAGVMPLNHEDMTGTDGPKDQSNMSRDLARFTERGRALVHLQVQKGREIVAYIPEPIQLQLTKFSRRSLLVSLEIFAGLFVVCMVALALAYGRLNKGPISLSSIVPVLEEAINRELVDLEVKIDDAIIQREAEGPGVNFRLRNIRLVDPQGAVVARAPLAAVGLSGRALLRGRIAPGSVDFIGPRLLLFYTAEEGLSLSFSRDAEAGTPAQQSAGPAGNAGLPIIGTPKDINLTRTVTAAFDQARRHKTASSFLTRFGVRDAVVVFDQLGKQSFWQVPDFSIDLEHKKRESLISGQGEVSSSDGPWKFNFRSEQSSRQNSLAFTAIIQDLVPSALAANFPGFPALESIRLPLSAETSIQLSTSGELLGAEAKLDIAQGLIVPPWDRKRPLHIDTGQLHVRFDAKTEKLNILPSRLSWGRSHAVISGSFTPASDASGNKYWTFDLTADDAVLEADEFGLPPMKVKRWTAQGTVDKTASRIVLRKFVMELPDGLIEFAGSVIDTGESPAVMLAGNISPMPMATLKQMWPKFLAAGAREWVGERIGAGRVTGGSFEIDLKSGELDKIIAGGEIPDSALIMDLNASALEIFYIPEMPPVQTADATFAIRGQRMALNVPSGWVVLPSGKKVDLGAGKFTVDDLRPDPQTGIIEFDVKGTAAAVLELLDHQPLGYVREAGLKPGDLSGRTEGRFRLELPLKSGLEFDEIRMRGTARLDETKTTVSFGGANIEDGVVTFRVTEKALDASGDLVVNGVQSKLNWQRIFDAPADKQPELRLSAVLDGPARAKLGVKLDHMVRGPVAAVISVEQVPPKTRPRKIAVQADLARAELILANVGWRKTPGRAAVLGFDLGTGAEGNTELQNFRIIGDDIAIDGWISFGKNEKPNAFYFPDFSFNVITHLEVRGKLRSDNVWEISAHGPAYDGRQLFRSLFSAGQLANDLPPPPNDYAGVDLTARIGAVVGFFDTTAKDVSLDVSRRAGRLVKLDAKGTLKGNAGIAAKLVDGGQNERVLLAESDDAGSAFRLIGFYPNMEGGQTSLKVTIDAQGLASKTGTLWARDFTVLGDRVVSEVVSNASDDPSASLERGNQRQRATRRQRIPFNQLEVPFSVGDGKFILYDSYVNGPQLGATLRGTVDFSSNNVDLGGTFVPLYGLNSALGSIPIIGNILVGRRGEGVVGITYTVKGPAGDPRVQVNPLSIVTPGIFRQIFEFTGKTPDTLPRTGEAHQQPSVSPYETNRFGAQN